MKTRAILREAWRNTTTGTSRAQSLALATTLLVLLMAGADMAAVSQLLERANEYRSRGAAVTILTAEGKIDGHRCDRLADLPGVRAAGAIRATSEQLSATVLRSAPIPLSESSPGLVSVLNATPSTAGVLLGPEAAKTFGIHHSGAIATPSGSIPVGGTYSYPDDGRRPGLSYAAIAPTPSNAPFDECWVDTWPPNQSITAALLITMRTTSTETMKKPTISQLNTTLGTTFDGPARFEGRTTRFAGTSAAIGGLILGTLSVRLRRLQFASALHAGVSRRALLAVATAESLAWLALSAALANPLTVVAAIAFGNNTGDLIPVGLAAAAPAWLAALAGTWLGLAITRERHLFRYFKTR